MGNQESKPKMSDLEVRKFSHFPVEDVKRWTTYFTVNYPAGYMVQSDFEEIFLSFFPFGEVRNFCASLFQTINIGQTGNVDFSELLIAFSILTKGSNFEKVRWIFRFYDQDKDGFVSRTEMMEGIEDLQAMVRGTVAIKSDPKTIVDRIFLSVENESGFLTFGDFEKLSEVNSGSLIKLLVFND
ncbi:neuronal calcium sensor 1 [Pancytospora epiphaga]|nr:neuronal calcium sensor 1 [Pancytospora epiphaga]